MLALVLAVSESGAARQMMPNWKRHKLKYMRQRDSRIDDYIAKSADFAQPILKHLRELVHAGCPDVEETMKWSRPHFMHQGMLCGISAFKNHCTFGFWKGQILFGAREDLREGMGQFGRITSLSDLPTDDIIIGYIRKAAQLNKEGINLPAKPKPKEKKELVIPEYFTMALKKNKKAMAAFEGFSYSHKKEYVQWITEAKGEDTRQRRMNQALTWMAEGKPRHWKYANC